MLKRKPNEKGFTLIEVIVTLILVGITAALAGMWIVSVANGYVFAKMNASTVQKGQLALTRIAKELSAIQSISAATGAGITYTRPGSTLNSTSTIIISKSGNELQIKVDAANPQALTDSVSGFTLQYCNDYDSINNTYTCGETWVPTSRIIEFTLTLTGANNTPSIFTGRATPRNL